MTDRVQTLIRYRDEREYNAKNPVGEASGRIYTDDCEEVKNLLPAPPLGSRGVLQALRILMDRDPVLIRDEELIVGDYYYLLPFELIEMPMFFTTHGTQVLSPTGHTVVNIEKLLQTGLGGLLKEIDTAISEHTDKDAIDYLDDLKGIVTLMQQQIRRYAAASAEKYSRTKDPQYLELKSTIESIISDPPRSLRAALQLHHFYIMFERTTSAGMGGCRFDQVFLPFYQHDLGAGVVTRQEALELIQAILLKEPLFYSIGGVDASGQDATNDLSFLVLDAYDQIGGPSNLSVKINAVSDPKLVRRALEILNTHRTGVPNLVNDDLVITSLLHWGFSEEEARGNCFAGCFWFVVPGKEYPSHDMEAISAVDILLDALKASCHPTFDSLYETYLQKQKEAIDLFAEKLKEIESASSSICPEPVISLLTSSCISKGLDITQGGADSSMTTVLFIGLATVADSLSAIKQLVFDTGSVSYERFIKAMDQDFRDSDEVVQKIKALNTFGNDDEQSDRMAVEVARAFKQALSRKRNSKGFPFRPAFYSWNRHVSIGSRLGATADGRHASKPVSQGVNPTRGRSKEGLTALINSVSKIGYSDTVGAPIHLNLSEHINIEVLESVVHVAFKKGIMQLIINYVDHDTLVDAYEHPNDHWDLIIRVTGYSARFVSISKDIQREIIERYIH